LDFASRLGTDGHKRRALVFADGLTAPGGELRVWASARHLDRALPALRELLEQPYCEPEGDWDR